MISIHFQQQMKRHPLLKDKCQAFYRKEIRDFEN